jgi:photosystem II stability/assembly factor-like uncharacterized protein
MKRLACAVVVLFTATASAHKRPASLISIEIRDAQHLLAGTTFGAVTSDDAGATWHWTCEQGLHYQDPFDPDYAYAQDGAILEQTTVSTWLKRDLCGDDVQPIPVDTSAVEAGPDGALYATAYDGTIYKAASSTASFVAIPAPASVLQWTSIEVSPSDAQRIYLAGFRMNGTAKEHVLYMSNNGGTSWSPMSNVGFPTGSASLLTIAGIGASDTLYVYSFYEDDESAAIYKSINAGGTWTKIFSFTADPYGLAFLARRNGDLVIGTRASGAFRSTNGGTSWEPLAGAPHISALAETPTGEVWAGTQPVTQLPPPMNPGLPTIEGDGYLLMHSADLATWSPGVAMTALLPTSCATGTPVRQACVDMRYDLGTAWCCLVSEYQVDPADLDCTGPNLCGGYQDGMSGPDVTHVCHNCGCCDAGAAGTSIPTASILLILLRRGRSRVRRKVCQSQRR